ncbi:MAG: helix-turn-helix domain-containing protein [Steroidobacteraceae bacterium]
MSREQIAASADPLRSPRSLLSPVAGLPSASEDLLTAEEVAAVLRMTPAWVYAQTRSRQIPHIRLGRYVRYRREALIQWVEQLEDVSAAPLENR